MKILQMNFEKGWRGGERQTLYCMRVLRELGHEVGLLCRAGTPLHQQAEQAGYITHPQSGVAGQLGFLSRRARRYDIVHAQTANTVTWAVLTKLLHGCPVVFSRRTAFPLRPGSEWKTLLKWRRVDGLVAISAEAAQAPRRLGLNPVIIRSAVESRQVDAAAARQLAQELRLSGKKVLATSAALSREKDPLTLVRAVAALRKTRDDFVFVHFGADGDSAAAVRAEVQAQGLEQVYLFAGFRQGMEDYYSIMDVFVMSSRQEALGSSVLDAFLQRVPVVSTDAGGLKESLADGRGVLCAVGDAPALAQGMTRCLDDLVFREKVVQRAYDYVRAEHDVQTMGQRYLELYERLLAQV